MEQTKIRSIFDQTYEAIMNILEDVRRKGEVRLPSEAEMGKMLGVSNLTVRRVLAQMAKERLIDRHHGRGTFIRPADASRTIGVVVMKDFARTFDPEFTAAILRGIGLEANSRSGTDVQLLSVDETGTNDLADKMVNDLRNLRVDGYIVTVPIPLRDCLKAQENNVPIVLVNINFEREDLPAVLINSEEMGRMIGKHLNEKGSRKAALAGGPIGGESLRSSAAIVRGMKEHLGERAPAQPDTHIEVDLTEAGGRKAIDHFLSLPEPPDSIVTIGDRATRGALATLKERGNNGHDDPELISILDTPEISPLAAIQIPSKEYAGREAARMLCRRMDGESLEERVRWCNPEWIRQ